MTRLPLLSVALTCCLLSVLLSASWGVEPAWKAVTMEGESAVGAIANLTAERITLTTTAGEAAFPVNRLLSLTPLTESPSSLEKPTVWVEFTDRSRIPAANYEAIKGNVKITLTGGAILETKVNLIYSVRWNEAFDPNLRAGREEAAGDQLGIKKANSVDFLDGTLGDITKESVNFTLDGDVIPVNRNKVDSLLYLLRADVEFPTPLCVLEETNGGQLQAATLSLSDGKLAVVTVGGIAVERSLEQIRKWDFSAGKLQYLSDLKPETTVVTPNPLLYKPQIVAFQQYFMPRMDRGHFQEQLQLDGKNYSKGLALCSKTELTYKLPAKFRRFQAVAGIDDTVGDDGEIALIILGDGKELYRGVFRGKDKSAPLDVDLGTARKLTIVVDYGEGAPLSADISDKFNLCEARIVK